MSPSGDNAAEEIQVVRHLEQGLFTIVQLVPFDTNLVKDRRDLLFGERLEPNVLA